MVRGKIDEIERRRKAKLLKECEEQDVQTVELGLVREAPRRTFRNYVRAAVETATPHSQWTQWCKRCLGPINLEEPIAEYGEGWCHMACRFRPVARGP